MTITEIGRHPKLEKEKRYVQNANYFSIMQIQELDLPLQVDKTRQAKLNQLALLRLTMTKSLALSKASKKLLKTPC